MASEPVASTAPSCGQTLRPPDSFPRTDWHLARPFTHPPFDPEHDLSMMIAWAARNASVTWAEMCSPQQRESVAGDCLAATGITFQIFVLAVCDKVLEANQWARIARGWTRFLSTVAEWRAASDALIPPIYNLALESLPANVPLPEPLPSLDTVYPFARGALDHSFRRLVDADAVFPRAARASFDPTFLNGLLPASPTLEPIAKPTLRLRLHTQTRSGCASSNPAVVHSVSKALAAIALNVRTKRHKLAKASARSPKDKELQSRVARHRRVREAAASLASDMERLDIRRN